MSVKLWVPSSSGHPPKKTPSEDFHMQTHSHCEQHSAFHFNQSQQAINTTHPWGFGSHYSLLGKKKYYEKNQRGELIEPAAVCSTYEMSQSSCCCTGFFLQGMSRREQWKNQNKMFTLLIHDYAFTPQATMPFAGLGTWILRCIFCKNSSILFITMKRFFLFSLFV